MLPPMNMRACLGLLACMLLGVSIQGCGGDGDPNQAMGDSAATETGAETAPDSETDPSGAENDAAGGTETGDDTGTDSTGTDDTGTDDTGTDETDDTGTGGSEFTCGELECDSATQYCQVYVAGQRGEPDSYQCLEVPGECSQATDCACLDEIADVVNPCECSEEDGLTVTCVTP
jgi:hypothetical protein